jgi:hypothetical protein
LARRYFALILGVFYTLIAVLGLLGIESAPPAGAPDLSLDTGYGLIFGLFPTNILHDLVHLVIGLWGIYAYTGVRRATVYARTVAIIFAILTIMGLIPALRTTFGLIPLYGADVWLHAITAILAAYFGWIAPYDREALT